MQPIALEHGRFTGAGGAALLASAAAAQFVLIGEEHGFAEPADVTRALVEALRPQGRRYLIAEIGPLAAADIERLARAGDRDAWSDLYRRAPFSVPFFWFIEDIAMAEAAVDGAADDVPLIWGIDQEFMLSPSLHFAALRERAADADTRAFVDALDAADRAAFRTLTETRDPAAAALTLAGAPPFAELRARFAGDPDALARIEALADSHAIYALFHAGRGFDNNLERARLMKRLLRERLQATSEGPGAARLIGKFGANHVQRGHTPMGILDIGTFLAELAAWNGNTSFHLLVLPVGGARNQVLPFTGPEAAAVPVSCTDLGAYAPLCAAAGEVRGWQYVDLAALRPRRSALARQDPALAELVLGFDAVLFVGGAQPATMVPGNLAALNETADRSPAAEQPEL
ncbi:MAG TPA: hypothetical protein VF210_12875 [Pseudomonadales bacterium]